MQLQFMPGSLLSREQAIQLMDLTADEQFKDIVTRSTKCALSENDDFAAGRPVAPPTETEDLITHWQIHVQAFQSREYKELMPQEIKAIQEQHLYVTEYLMHEKAFGLMDSMGMPIRMPNVTFQQRLMLLCPDFPMLLQSPPPVMPMMAPGAPMGGSAPLAPASTDGLLQATPLDAGAPVSVGGSAAPPSLPPQGV